jgi:hypothetical protein
MLFFLEHDESVQHVEVCEEDKALDNEAIRPIDNGENQSHHSQGEVILVGPEPFMTIKVTLKVELFVDGLVFRLNALCQQPLENLRAVDLPDDNVVIGKIIQP